MRFETKNTNNSFVATVYQASELPVGTFAAMSILTRILGLGSKADAKAGVLIIQLHIRTVREVRTQVSHPEIVNSAIPY